MPEVMTVSRAVLELRRIFDLSQSAFGQKVGKKGVSKMTIWEWESATTASPSRIHLLDLIDLAREAKADQLVEAFEAALRTASSEARP